MKLTRQYIEKHLFLLALLVYAGASYFIMPAIDNTAEMGTMDTVFSETVAIIASLPYLLFALKDLLQKKHDKTVKYFLVFFVWAVIATVLNYSAPSYIVFAMMPFFPLLISYLYFRKYELDKAFYIAFFLSFLVISFRYLQIYQTAHFNADTQHIGVSYFALVTFPLVLLHPSKTVRIAAWIITLLIVTSSIKRGGLIAFSAGAVVYMVCKQYVSPKKWLWSFILLLLAFIVFSASLIYAISYFESEILDRIARSRDDQGSGRLEIWKMVIDDISRSDTFSLVCGHGYLSVCNLTNNEGLPAHNDFLEVLYDFGLTGIVLYGIAWLSLVGKTLRMLREKSELAPVMALMVSVFFILSMISIVIYYFQITYILLFIGTVIGQYELRKTNSLVV